MPYKYLMYLRKSRQDNPDETVEEVLAKHETRLQEYARRELGGEIPEEQIYREVVSGGESIEERVEIKKVLALIEDPDIVGVIVADPQRLTRGSLRDVDQLINMLRFTNTRVVTPMMTYNLENKMERKFFQDELLRGRDYLDYVRETLQNGREAAVKRGCYLGSAPPYGYDKVKIGKDHTLRPNDNAEVVRMIYEWYANDMVTPYRIAQRLNEMGIKSATGIEWRQETIRQVLTNEHYIGRVIFNQNPARVYVENGEQRIRKKKNNPEDIIRAEGKHPAIIPMELWERAQERKASNPTPHKHPLRNPLAGLLYCSVCGKKMELRTHPIAEDRMSCPRTPICIKSYTLAGIKAALLVALEEAELPELEARAKNGDGSARKVQEKLIAKLEKQMEEYRQQEETQYELLETKKYTQALFDRRNASLHKKMEECKGALYKARAAMPQAINYEERIISLKDAIAMLKDPSADPVSVNNMLKAIIDRIDYSAPKNTGRGGRYKRHDFKLDITLRL